MNYKIKAALRTWEIAQRYQMPQGGKMTLAFILEEERNRAGNNPTGLAMPEFLDTIHPCLYPIFVINWRNINAKRIPTKFRGDGLQFLRDVMSSWFKVCAKNTYYIDSMFSSFCNVREVEEAICFFTNDDFTYIGEDGNPSVDYVDMEYRMGARRAELAKQQQLEDQKAREQQELEEKARRKKEEAERKEAKAKSNEAKPDLPSEPSVDQLMLEAQQLFNESPLPPAVLQLYVRPNDTDEPYTAEIVWSNVGKNKKDYVQPDVFTGKSFPIVIAKAKIHVSNLINELIEGQKKERQRREIEQKISEQNDAFSKQMEESRRMLQQLQDVIAEQQRQHEANISELRAQIEEL